MIRCRKNLSITLHQKIRSSNFVKKWRNCRMKTMFLSNLCSNWSTWIRSWHNRLSNSITITCKKTIRMSKYSKWLKQSKFWITRLTRFERRSRWEIIRDRKHQKSFHQMPWRNRRLRVSSMFWRNLLSRLRTCRQDMMEKCKIYKKCLNNIGIIMNSLSVN